MTEIRAFGLSYKPRLKGVEGFLRRCAFNLGNSPSQTEVKIISCIPIDVSDLQTKILQLEKELDEYRWGLSGGSKASRGSRGSQGSGVSRGSGGSLLSGESGRSSKASGTSAARDGASIRPEAINEMRRKIDKLEKLLIECQQRCNQPQSAHATQSSEDGHPPSIQQQPPVQPPQTARNPPPDKKTTPIPVLPPVQPPQTARNPPPDKKTTPIPVPPPVQPPQTAQKSPPFQPLQTVQKPPPVQPTKAERQPPPESIQHAHEPPPKKPLHASKDPPAIKNPPVVKDSPTAKEPPVVKDLVAVNPVVKDLPPTKKSPAPPAKQTFYQTMKDGSETVVNTAHCAPSRLEIGIAIHEHECVDKPGISVNIRKPKVKNSGANSNSNSETERHSAPKRLLSANKTDYWRYTADTEREPSLTKKGARRIRNIRRTERPTVNVKEGPYSATVKVGRYHTKTEAKKLSDTNKKAEQHQSKSKEVKARYLTIAEDVRHPTNTEFRRHPMNTELGRQSTNTETNWLMRNTESRQQLNIERRRTNTELGWYRTDTEYGRHPTNMDEICGNKNCNDLMPDYCRSKKSLRLFERSSKKIKKTLKRLMSLHAQPHSPPCNKCNENWSRSRHETSSHEYISTSYLEAVARKQYKPDRVSMISSGCSRISTPICRDRDSTTPDAFTGVTDLDWCHVSCHSVDRSGPYVGYIDTKRRRREDHASEGFLDMDRHRLPVDSMSSTDYYNQPPGHDRSAYYDSSLYDIVPVRDTPRQPNINETPRNAKDSRLKPNCNGRLPAKRRKMMAAKVPHKYESFKRLLHHNSVRKTSRLDTHNGTMDFNYVYIKPFLKNKSRKTKNPTQQKKKVLQKKRECLVDQTHTECQTAASKIAKLELEPPVHGRAEETLDEIKSILQSVLAEVKEDAPRNTPPQGMCNTIMQRCVIGGQVTAPSEPCCPFKRPLGSPPPQPVNANECLQSYPLLVHTTGPQYACCYPTAPKNTSPPLANTTATNIDSASTKQRSKATEKLIKDIYKSIAVSMQQPPRETSTSGGDNACEGIDSFVSQSLRPPTALSIMISNAGSVRSVLGSRVAPPSSEGCQPQASSDSDDRPLRYDYKHSRRENIKAVTGEADSGATIALSQPKEKISLISKIKRLFNPKTKRESDKEVESVEVTEGASASDSDSQRSHGGPRPPARYRRRRVVTKISNYRFLARSDRRRTNFNQTSRQEHLFHDGNSYRHIGRTNSPYCCHQSQPPVTTYQHRAPTRQLEPVA